MIYSKSVQDSPGTNMQFQLTDNPTFRNKPLYHHTSIISTRDSTPALGCRFQGYVSIFPGHTFPFPNNQIQTDVKVGVYNLSFDVAETLVRTAQQNTILLTWLPVTLKNKTQLSQEINRRSHESNMVAELHSLGRSHQFME